MARFPFWLHDALDPSPARGMRRLSSVVDSLTGSSRQTTQAFPPVNVLQGKEDAVVTAEMPGVTPDEIDVSVKGEVVTIRASRAVPELQEGEVWHRHERGHGEFVRAISLPHRVDSDKVEASYTDGVLRLVLPRLEADKTRRIEVKTG